METPDTIADELLAIRCQLGEPEAFALLVDRWHEPLWKYVRRLTDSDESAADIVQDVWLRILRALPRLKDPARLRAWIFGIARRAMMDRYRQQYAAPELVPLDDVHLASSDEALDLEEALSVMENELALLPFLEREVLALFYLQELSLNQLSELLGVPVGTVKSRLFRARQLLRRQLLLKGNQ